MSSAAILPTAALKRHSVRASRQPGDVLPTPVADADDGERLLRLGRLALGCPLAFLTDQPDPGASDNGLWADRVVTGGKGAEGVLRALYGQGTRQFDSAVFDDIHALFAAWANGADAQTRVDSVSGLATRPRFINDIEALSKESQTGLTMVLVTLADARHFNEILRALGHAYSEDFIRAGAERVVNVVAGAARVYHVSVLSFAFFTPSSTAGEPPAVVERLVNAFRSELLCRDIPLATRAGVGIASLQSGDAAETMRHAVAAAQDSRQRVDGWSFFDPATDQAHRRAFSLLDDLRHALQARDQLSLNFQPRIDFATGRACGAEALLRWTHPTLGFVSPAEFVPLAEATALIRPLTSWVLDAAIAQSANWRAQGIPLRLSANVSVNNLREADFVEMLDRRLRAAGVHPSDFEIEFTEGAFAAEDKLLQTQVARLHDLGVHIAIDDFGTGYSNMNYLTRIPAHYIKIDQSFIRPLESDVRLGHVVQTIIAMAHGLGFKVVAEGIETEAIFNKMSAWGCHEGQGYFMSRPLGRDAFAAWWRAQA